MQTTYGFPPGCLTEGTLERGHGRVKLNVTCFSRNHSYKAENQDVMVRCLWCTDPLLLWERDFGQQIKAGNLRPRSSAEDSNYDEVDVMYDLPVVMRLEEGDECD